MSSSKAVSIFGSERKALIERLETGKPPIVQIYE